MKYQILPTFIYNVATWYSYLFCFHSEIVILSGILQDPGIIFFILLNMKGVGLDQHATINYIEDTKNIVKILINGGY